MQKSYFQTASERLYQLERRLFVLEKAELERKFQSYETRIERLQKAVAERVRANQSDPNRVG